MRTFRALLLVWLTVLALVVRAQSPSTLIKSHPLLQGLQDWWRGVPGVVGGNVLYNLIRRNDATLTTFSTVNSPASGWNLTDRLGGTTHLAFNSAGQYLPTSQNAGLTVSTPFTLCVWAYAPVSMITRMFMGTQNNNSPYDGIYFQWANSGFAEGLEFGIVSSTTGVNYVRSPTNSLPIGSWVHSCAVYDGSQTMAGMSLYINGQSQTLTTSPGTWGAFTDYPWTLGALSTGSVCCTFNGNLDDWRVWTRALSAGEIAQVYRLSRQNDLELFRQGPLEVLPAAAAAPGHPGAMFPFFR